MNDSANDNAAMAARAEEVKRLHQRDLMVKANVVGVGIGYRTVQGQPTGEIGLVVMVTRKVPRNQLDPADIVPHDIDGVPVDVQAVGEIRAY